MVIGIGIDVIGIDRIADLFNRHRDRIVGDLVTEREWQSLLSDINIPELTTTGLSFRQITRLGKLFAAKEATIKAITAHHLPSFGWSDIEVNGDIQLRITLSGELAQLARRRGIVRITGSASATTSECMAIIIGESE